METHRFIGFKKQMLKNPAMAKKIVANSGTAPKYTLSILRISWRTGTKKSLTERPQGFKMMGG